MFFFLLRLANKFLGEEEVAVLPFCFIPFLRCSKVFTFPLREINICFRQLHLRNFIRGKFLEKRRSIVGSPRRPILDVRRAQACAQTCARARAQACARDRAQARAQAWVRARAQSRNRNRARANFPPGAIAHARARARVS